MVRVMKRQLIRWENGEKINGEREKTWVDGKIWGRVTEERQNERVEDSRKTYF
jgi:hypothetical protein